MRRSSMLGCCVATVIGAICLGGCGEPAPRATTHVARLWPFGVWEPAHGPGDLSVREHGLLELPWAGSAGPDAAPADPRVRPTRFVVNIDEKHSIYFKGKRWSLAPDVRAQAFESFRIEVGKLSQGRASDAAPIAALIRCDYRRIWRDVRDLIVALRTPPAAITHLHFATASSDEASLAAARIEADPVELRETSDVSASVVLDVLTSAGESGMQPRLVFSVGVLEVGPGAPDGALGPLANRSFTDRKYVFAAGDPYAGGPANDLANAHWQALRDGLRSARSRDVRTVDLTVDDGVPWAHVAMTLGMCVDTGVESVRVQGVGSYRLSTPARASSAWQVGDRDARDWPPLMALGVGAAIAVGVFGLSALTARRRRRLDRSGVPGAS